MQLTKHWAATLDDYAIDLAWSPDGTTLAAASAAGPISIFALADGAKQHELPGHEGGTNTLAWMPTPRRAEGRDQRAETGDRRPETGEPATGAANPAPTSDLRPLTSGSLLATGGQDGAVKFWDAAAGQHTATAKLGHTWVEHLAWCPRQASDVRGQTSEIGNQESAMDSAPLTAGWLFAAAGRTLTALRPDASIAHTFKPAPKTICALAAQPAGGSIAAASFGGVVLWDADDFIAQKELPYSNGIHALVWSPDSKWLVSGNQDPSVHLWIPENDIELHMSGYEGKVKFLSFDSTSRWLATSGGREACIWDCLGAGPEGREPAMLPHESPVCAVKFQNSLGLLVTGSTDGVVQLWSPERRLQPLRATVRMPSAATKFAWSPDDRHLAIGTERGSIYVLTCAD
jgi:WD40 repeat protein